MSHRSRRVALCAVAASCVLVPASPALAQSQTPETSGVIVQFKAGTSEAQQQSAVGGGRAQLLGRIFKSAARVVRLPGTSPEALAAKLNRNANVEFAEVDKVLHATALPNDPGIYYDWGIFKVQAPAAWDALGLGGFPAPGNIKVGIVDTGIRRTHEEFAGKVVDCATASQPLFGIFGGGTITEGNCADGNGHGTHVAGTIAANANNGKGIAGTAFNAKLSICKALDDNGSGATSAISACIRWLKDKGVKVISMSLGGGGTTTMQQAVQYAYSGGNGALVVAASGNGGNATPNYPAAYAEAVSVGATDSADAIASFSTYNDDVEISAPGVYVASTWNGNDSDYKAISGTSMATPRVAGVAALIAARGGNAAAIRAKLDASVDDLGPAGRDQRFGFGRVNALKAAQ